MTIAFASACLVAAAIAIGWPEHSRQARRRRLGLPAGQRSRGLTVAIHQAVAGHRVDRPALVGRLAEPGLWSAAGALAAFFGLLLAGPVTAALLAGYGALAVRWLGLRERRRATVLARSRMLDSLGSLTADLRAGLPANLESIVDSLSGAADPLAARAAAAVSLAESTGAPLADLLERIEADARADDRARANAEAQSAGARATALLLAGLPLGGIGLGYAVGADPLVVLLHTPLGGACALAALGLQCAGLAWSARLTRPTAVAG